MLKNWGIKLSKVIGWLTLLAAISGLATGNKSDFENLKVGLCLIIGSWAYSSALRRRLALLPQTLSRRVFEWIGISTIIFMIILQKDLAELISTHPFSNFVVPIWAVIAYVTICNKATVKSGYSHKFFDRNTTDAPSNSEVIPPLVSYGGYDFIVCPKCRAKNECDLLGVAGGDRIACEKCNSGLILTDDGEIIPPNDPSTFLSEINKPKNRSSLFLLRHWRGELSLPVSYWVVSIISWIFVWIVGLLSSGIKDSLKYFDPLAIWLTFVGTWTAIAAIGIWQAVGLYRASKKYQKRYRFNKKYIYGTLGKVAAVLGVLQGVKPISDVVIPQFNELTRILFDDDPSIPPYKISITQQGTELKIEGGFKYGLVAEVQKLLSVAADINTINLESVGGRIGVAEDLFNIIQERNLNTVTNVQCASACAIAFAAGNKRWLGFGAKLGFHSGHFVGVSKTSMDDYSRTMNLRIFQKNGTSLAFLEKGQGYAPDEMWYPTKKELLSVKYITAYQSEAASSKELIHQHVRNSISLERKSLPKKLDEITYWVDAVANGAKMEYTYEVSGNVPSDIENNKIWSEIRNGTKDDICAKSELAESLLDGISYVYRYRRDQNKQTLVFFEVKSCN